MVVESADLNVGETLELHASGALITLYFRQQSVATHTRAMRAGMITEPAQMPTRHRRNQQQWTPGRPKNWARDIGPGTLASVEAQRATNRHPERHWPGECEGAEDTQP